MGDRKEIDRTVIMTRPAGLTRRPRPTDACIILIHPPGPDIGLRTSLGREEYTLGRDAGVDVVVWSRSVSRRHARLLRDGSGGWHVEDLGSTNGTFVNEQRTSRQALSDGDQIRLGDTIFKFLIGANVEAVYHEEIHRMTIVDGLTGVHNRRYFLDFLDREVAGAHRHHHPLSLVLMDLDRFKVVNDDRGHQAGDAVLKAMALRIKQRVRRADLFARYGGEEFAAVLTVTPLAGAIRFAENVRSMIASVPFSFAGESFPVTLSLGIATLYNQPTIDADTLIKQADENLYEAKRRGRNCCVPGLAEIAADLGPGR